MFRRIGLLSAGGLALLCALGAPGRLPAQARFRPNGLPTGGTPAGLVRPGPTTGTPVDGNPFWRSQGRWSARPGTGRPEMSRRGWPHHWRHGHHNNRNHHPRHARWGRRR
jgi:hypothetical protein